MKVYELKANHNLVLPDGKTKIKVGEVFEWARPISVFGNCVVVVGEKEIPDETPDNGEVKPTLTQIRARAKELKIANYSRKDAETLTAEIAEAEAALANNNPDEGNEESETPDNGENANVGE